MRLSNQTIKQHRLLLVILLIHLSLALAYSALTPLGEAPDEPAHLAYARFLAKHGRLPATLVERGEAGYRSAWPPLYHLLVTLPLTSSGDTPPTRLKAVGDTPRRLIPTNGQTIASFIHTADEAWPWRGISLAWHLSRFISVLLMASTVAVAYFIAWRLTRQRRLAASAAALQAFLPQALFVGSVVNDDNLLSPLSGLTLLALVNYTHRANRLKPGHFFLLGALLGLATVAKYNALPLWAIAFAWIAWFTPLRLATHLLRRLLALFSGAALTGGWWFVFIWRHFNQVEAQGLISGSLAALSAGVSDASLRQLSSGDSLTLPAWVAWVAWFRQLFQTFWGSFGGGSTIEFPGWVYGLLAIICLVAITALVKNQLSVVMFYTSPQARNFSLLSHQSPITNYQLPITNAFSGTPQLPISPQALIFFLLSPLLFLPLPLLRFALSGSIVETAQGRHLFPTLPLISLALVLGLTRLADYVKYQVSGLSSQKSNFTFYVSRFTFHVLRFTPYTLRATPILLPLLAFILSLYGLNLIQASYPPPIPLTTAQGFRVDKPLQARLTESITLIGYEVGRPQAGVLPVTLLWRAEAIPPEDYLIELILTGSTGQAIGSWLGHPIGGRYPTRAWDAGDILRDTIPFPLLPNPSISQAHLTLTLYDSNDQPASRPLVFPLLPDQQPNLSLSHSSTLRLFHSPTLPPQLRADGLPPDAPFSYRSTLSLLLPPQTTPPVLIAPDGQAFQPIRFLNSPGGSLAHFIVAANWPSANYQLPITNYQLPITNYQLLISNRPRQFEPPPMAHIVNANFADHLTLLGYDLPQRRVEPGASFPVTLHLRAERTMGQNLVIFNHLLDRETTQRGGVDRIPQNFYTTLLWVPGEIVSDAYQVPVDANAPPGVYWLDVGLYPDQQPAFSLPLFVAGRPIAQNSVRLGPLKVGGPPPAVTVASPPPNLPLDISFGNQITLLGFDLPSNYQLSIINYQLPITNTFSGTSQLPITNAFSGTPQLPISNLQSPISTPLTLTLFWQPTIPPAADYTVFIHLADTAGQLVAQADGPPAGGAYPTSLWEPGEIIVDERLLPDLPPGRYQVRLGLYRPETNERLPIPSSPDGALTLLEFEVR